MALKVTKVPVWVGDIPDQPGGLDAVFAKLADAGADLQCVIARRQSEKPGRGVVFVTPITGRKQEGAAHESGLQPTTNIVTLRVEGDDQPGFGHRMTQAIADMGVNLRGMTAAVLGRKFIVYLALDTEADAIYATDALKKVGGRARTRGTAKRRTVSRGGTRKTAKRTTKRATRKKTAKRSR
jgi:hypothetical protein